MPLAARTRLGVFEILAPLGKGGGGGVYRARDTRLDRDVAVKVLPAELTDDETYRKRLLADIEAWLAEKPDHHQVQVVREELFGNG